MKIFLIALGGFFGSITRSVLSDYTKSFLSTWIVNVFGSILLAIALYFYLSYHYAEIFYISIAIGFCGAFTTFSTFSYESFCLLKEKRYLIASLYIFTPVLLTITIVYFILYRFI